MDLSDLFNSGDRGRNRRRDNNDRDDDRRSSHYNRPSPKQGLLGGSFLALLALLGFALLLKFLQR